MSSGMMLGNTGPAHLVDGWAAVRRCSCVLVVLSEAGALWQWRRAAVGRISCMLVKLEAGVLRRWCRTKAALAVLTGGGMG